MSVVARMPKTAKERGRIAPKKLAHFVLRTKMDRLVRLKRRVEKRNAFHHLGAAMERRAFHCADLDAVECVPLFHPTRTAWSEPCCIARPASSVSSAFPVVNF